MKTQKTTTMAVVEFYRSSPQASIKEAAESLGVSLATVQYHLKKALAAGLVHRTRKWRSVSVPELGGLHTT